MSDNPYQAPMSDCEKPADWQRAKEIATGVGLLLCVYLYSYTFYYSPAFFTRLASFLVAVLAMSGAVLMFIPRRWIQ